MGSRQDGVGIEKNTTTLERAGQRQAHNVGELRNASIGSANDFYSSSATHGESRSRCHRDNWHREGDGESGELSHCESFLNEMMSRLSMAKSRDMIKDETTSLIYNNVSDEMVLVNTAKSRCYHMMFT
jgi:hypothetical protein